MIWGLVWIVGVPIFMVLLARYFRHMVEYAAGPYDDPAYWLLFLGLIWPAVIVIVPVLLFSGWVLYITNPKEEEED